MKADVKELRIGNYLQNPKNGDVFQVCREDFKFEKGLANLEDYEPIELTEEWLLKMGGEKLPHFTISNSIFLKTKRNQQLSFGCVGTPNLIVFIQEIENENITDLIAIHNWDYDGEMYVHQLQNLYFALTGEELTIKN